MNKEMNFVAIEADGKEKWMNDWNHADVISLVEELANKRADLYEVLDGHFAEKGKADDGILCSEPMPSMHKGEASGKKVTSFKSTLTHAELEMLANVANEIGIFVHPKEVTAEVLAAFFRCEATGLQVRNLRLFCAMMTALFNHGYIGYYWQAPIYRCRLLLAYGKEAFVNRSDLTTANYEVKNTLMDKRIERIEAVIRAMKKGEVQKH